MINPCFKQLYLSSAGFRIKKIILYYIIRYKKVFGWVQIYSIHFELQTIKSNGIWVKIKRSEKDFK